jgi:hypothetical protein
VREPAICGLVLLGIVENVTAQPAPAVNSAAWMLPGCRAALTPSPDPDFRQGMCAGSIGTLLFLGDALPDQYRVCRPRGAVLHDAVGIVVSHIEAQPAREHENFNGLAMEALSAAWPCR